MNQRHKHADVIIAWANGAEIESKVAATGEWMRAWHPGWHEACEYRVKPPTKKYKLALFDRHCETSFVKAANNEFEAGEYEKSRNFIRWLTDWIEYEE